MAIKKHSKALLAFFKERKVLWYGKSGHIFTILFVVQVLFSNPFSFKMHNSVKLNGLEPLVLGVFMKKSPWNSPMRTYYYNLTPSEIWGRIQWIVLKKWCWWNHWEKDNSNELSHDWVYLPNVLLWKGNLSNENVWRAWGICWRYMGQLSSCPGQSKDPINHKSFSRRFQFCAIVFAANF